MPIKKFKPTSPARRTYAIVDTSDLSKVKPEKSLVKTKVRSGGRNVYGRLTSINKGGGHKRKLRLIDFKRDKDGIPGKVATIEYDPNRSARIALIAYPDGEKRYILAPSKLEVGQEVVSGSAAPIKPGNSLPIRDIPTGQELHNIELKIGAGGILVRSAGNSAQLLAKEGSYATLRMPSGEMRKVHLSCRATIGTVGNSVHKNVVGGKAGRSRWLGKRPHTRGICKNPVDHPMGGRTNGGKHPCTPSGKRCKGLKTRSNKLTDKFIVKRRSKKRR